MINLPFTAATGRVWQVWVTRWKVEAPPSPGLTLFSAPPRGGDALMLEGLIREQKPSHPSTAAESFLWTLQSLAKLWQPRKHASFIWVKAHRYSFNSTSSGSTSCHNTRCNSFYLSFFYYYFKSSLRIVFIFFLKTHRRGNHIVGRGLVG